MAETNWEEICCDQNEPEQDLPENQAPTLGRSFQTLFRFAVPCNICSVVCGVMGGMALFIADSFATWMWYSKTASMPIFAENPARENASYIEAMLEKIFETQFMQTAFDLLPILIISGVIAWFVNIAYTLGYGIQLWKMGAEEHRYRKAGSCILLSTLLVAALMPLTSFINQMALPIAVLSCSAILRIIGVCYEYRIHGDVLKNLDARLSRKCKVLGGWIAGINLLMCIAFLVYFYHENLIFLLIFVVVAIILFIAICALKTVYLYRAVNLFQDDFVTTEEETDI